MKSRSSPLGGKPVDIEAKADWLMAVGGPSIAGTKQSPREERAQLLSAATAELLQAESRCVLLTTSISPWQSIVPKAHAICCSMRCLHDVFFCRATSPAVDLDKKRGNPYLRHGGSLVVHQRSKESADVIKPR